MAIENIQQVWLQVVDMVKHRTVHPNFWRALEMSAAVTTEDDLFVVGFPAAHYPMSGLLLSSEHQNAIEKAIAEATGQSFRLKVIEGTTLGDWTLTKRREAASEAARRAADEKRRIEAAADRTWDGVAEQVSRRYAGTPLRQLPQVRARYLQEAIKIISDGMDHLYNPESADELSERALARVIEKVATLMEMPGPMVAMELLRYRESLGKQ